MTMLTMIATMALVTFPVRAISLLMFSDKVLPPLVVKALSLVPVAVLSAICTPLIFRPQGVWENPLFLIEFWAAVGSILFARAGVLAVVIVGIGIYIFGKIYF